MNKTKLDFDEVNIMQEYNPIEFAKETDIMRGCSRDVEISRLATGWTSHCLSHLLFWNTIVVVTTNMLEKV